MVNSVQGPNSLGATLPTPGAANPAQAQNKPAMPQAAGATAPAQGASKAAGAAISDAAGSGANTQDRFLKLLVTQMKNQDPLNPMDNAQVTSQMAQLSTVSGIDKINATLKALSDNMSAGQSMSATSMIGHGALVPGASVELKEGKGLAGVDLAQSADAVKVQIKDGANNIVRTIQMGAQKQGVIPLAWDGKDDTGEALPDGPYKISAEFVSGDKTEPAKTLAFGMVNGVVPGSAGAKLDVSGLGSFNLADVKQVV
ncbi:MAG: flagellar hook assembly protein FlgD [Gallionellaceae bacterium]|nr:flagellar hook assembly protein FlgD [Gallionellaceae bacterium]